MKEVIVVVLVVILLTSGLLVSCGGVRVTGSGNLITETFESSDFTADKPPLHSVNSNENM